MFNFGQSKKKLLRIYCCLCSKKGDLFSLLDVTERKRKSYQCGHRQQEQFLLICVAGCSGWLCVFPFACLSLPPGSMAERLCCDKGEMQLQALCEIPLPPVSSGRTHFPLEIRGLECNRSLSPLSGDPSRQRKLGHVVPSGELLIGGYVVSLVWAEIVRAPYCGNPSQRKRETELLERHCCVGKPESADL